MAPEHLTLGSHIILYDRLDILLSDPSHLTHLLDGYRRLENQVRFGGSIKDLRTRLSKAGDREMLDYPEGTPRDAPVFSMTWEVSFSMAEALLWARNVANSDWIPELYDRWADPLYGPCPYDRLEELHDKLMANLSDILEEWKGWDKDGEPWWAGGRRRSDEGE